MKLPVVRKTSSDRIEIVELDLNDVLFTFIEDGVIHYQTDTEVFSHIHTLEEQEMYLKKMGFKKIERSILARLDKAKWYDWGTSIVYFDSFPSKSGPKAPVSRARRKHLPASLIHI